MIQKNWRSIIFTLAILLLILFELANLLLIGPLGFTQEMENTAGLAHFLTMNILYLRILLLGIIGWAAVGIFKKRKLYPKILIGIALLIYCFIFYMSNFKLKADKLFQDQNITITEPVSSNIVPLDEDVIGVSINGQSKAYPLDYLAFHHKVSDRVGDEPILVTYCIWCRSGRVFSPIIDGKLESFRLVGMTEYNAIIEDKTSSTWWQQATGEAIAGKKKGAKLNEVNSEQMSLESWIQKHPETQILQPDSSFIEEYDHNSKFVSRFGKVKATEYDPWQERSWIIGVANEEEAKAFDYLSLIENKVMQDSVGNLPVLVVLEPDTVSFHVWDTRVDTLALDFTFDSGSVTMMDTQTESIWDMTGTCISGNLEGSKLTTVQAYEEYWHSWKTFHPNTEKVREVKTDSLNLNN